ncbi:uncharacterized protein [Nicotiana tomentosiformis]|uniref:uncharacterized protein n=1 Tax=Nicotiana tomentosiformis TaxID=4098 RepID=UPI00388CA747
MSSPPVVPSTSTVAMPPPLSSGPSAVVPSTSTLRPMPIPTHPLSALRVSQILASLNNWMQTATAKLSDLSSAVVAQSSTSTTQIPPTVEATLKKILENQTTIMNTLVAHGSVIEELGKQVKKMRKSHASKKSVDDLPFDLLVGLDPPASAALAAPSIPVAPAGQSEEPDMAADTAEAVRQMFTHPVTPRAEDDEIQLEETEGGDAALDITI